MTVQSRAHIDLDRLFALRLVVARFGEMDRARWWNTRGLLGRHGAIVLARGFPATYRFASARVVFAVARSRCQRVFDPPGCMTLWNLPPAVEDAFEDRWHDWLDDAARWTPLFEHLAAFTGEDLAQLMSDVGLLTPQQRQALGRLRRSAQGRAVPLPGVPRVDDETITLLAAGFAKGEPGRPAIPYARLEA